MIISISLSSRPEIESHRRAHFPWVNRVTEVDEDTTAYHVEVGGVDLDVVVDGH